MHLFLTDRTVPPVGVRCFCTSCQYSNGVLLPLSILFHVGLLCDLCAFSLISVVLSPSSVMCLPARDRLMLRSARFLCIEDGRSRWVSYNRFGFNFFVTFTYACKQLHGSRVILFVIWLSLRLVSLRGLLDNRLCVEAELFAAIGNWVLRLLSYISGDRFFNGIIGSVGSSKARSFVCGCAQLFFFLIFFVSWPHRSFTVFVIFFRINKVVVQFSCSSCALFVCFYTDYIPDTTIQISCFG